MSNTSVAATFDPQVPVDSILESQRCILRYPSPADAKLILSAFTSPSSPKKVPLGQIDSLKEVEDCIDQCHRRWSKGRPFIWSVIMKDNHQFIGQVTLARLPDQDKWAIAYWIHPDYWDLGYATETTKTMVKYGYDHLKAKSIWAGVGTWNTGSIRVFEKPGMRLVADNPAGYTIGGKPIVTQEFEMSISAWRGTNRYHKC